MNIVETLGITDLNQSINHLISLHIYYCQLPYTQGYVDMSTFAFLVSNITNTRI